MKTTTTISDTKSPADSVKKRVVCQQTCMFQLVLHVAFLYDASLHMLLSMELSAEVGYGNDVGQLD